MSAYSEQVYEFTAKTTPVPERPRPMSRDEVMFIVRMVMSELGELVQTVESYKNTPAFMAEALSTIDQRELPRATTEDEVIADQADALVDAMYYIENAAVKVGVNLSEVFARVHAANMDKFRNGVVRREDGKIMKPLDWQPPNIVEEIRRQKKFGAFTHN